MLQNATRICEATLGPLFLYKGDAFRAVAVHGDSYYADWSRREPDVNMRTDVHKGTPLERLTHTRKFLHIHDLRADEGYLSGNPRIKALVDRPNANHRRAHAQGRWLVGAIVICQEVRPFGDKQIELVHLSLPGRHRDREHACSNRPRSLGADRDAREVLRSISRFAGG
jgi:hypothetical protein